MDSADAQNPDDQKPYQCTTCARRFARLEHLQRHTRTHTGDKPYVCWCGRRFTRNDLLKRHQQRAHSSTGAPSEGSSSIATSTQDQDYATQSRGIDNDDPVRVSLGGPTPSGFRADDASPLDPIQDFAAFTDSIGLAPDWNALELFDIEPALQRLESTSQQAEQTSSQWGATTNATFGDIRSETVLASYQAKLTEEEWQRLAAKVTSSQIYGFTLPSRYAMSRYFQSYAEQFHRHYPMLHLPTYSTETSPLCLTLAIAAVGARYRHESKNGRSLYDAAMTLTFEQRPNVPHHSQQVHNEHSISFIQTLVLLMGYGAWDWNTQLLGTALDLQGVLFFNIRSSLLQVVPVAEDGSLQWKDWIRLEECRRTILIAFAYLVIQSTAYNLPTVVLSSEIQDLQLPCELSVWEARSAQEWEVTVSRSKQTPVRVADALRYLLDSSEHSTENVPQLSEVGNFVILQALIQRIFLTRQLHTASVAALPSNELNTLQKALARWKFCFQNNENASLDPRNVDDAIPWTSVVFLSLAFARLHINIGPHRQLQTRDPKQISAALLSTPAPDRSPEMIPALLHAAHALSIPILMGIDYVSKNQTMFWTCEQALCGLESGVFLWKFLQSCESYGSHNLSGDERSIIAWVVSSISEAMDVVGANEFGMDDSTVVEDLSFSTLGILVLKAWARIFSSDLAWPLTVEIGMSLSLLAVAVESL